MAHGILVAITCAGDVACLFEGPGCCSLSLVVCNSRRSWSLLCNLANSSFLFLIAGTTTNEQHDDECLRPRAQGGCPASGGGTLRVRPPVFFWGGLGKIVRVGEGLNLSPKTHLNTEHKTIALGPVRPEVEAVPGSRQLRLQSPLMFRVGAHLVINPGRSTAEPAVVSGHTRTAVVLNEALEHSHEIRELVVQGLSAQKEKIDEEEHVEDRRLDITEDVSGLVRTGVVAVFLLRRSLFSCPPRW